MFFPSLFQSLGNHEFDNGISGLTPFVKNLTCPVLAANLILTKEPELQAEHNLMKSFLLNVGKTKIGIIGYLTPKTKVLSKLNDVEYIDEVEAIIEEVAMLKAKGVNILIALGHSGFETDLRIAKDVEDIDLVIGGHTNTFLWNGQTPDIEKIDDIYPKIVKQRSGRSVPVVQAYAYTKYLGQLNLVFDSNGEIIHIRDGNPILLDKSVPQDPEVLDIVHRYQGDILKITEQVVGNTSIVLDGSSCRLKECNMGNMITDAMIHKYASEYKGLGWTDAPIAIIQGGGIRTSIDHINSTNVTMGDLIHVMPFDGDIAKVTIKGVDVKRMLEHAVAEYKMISALGQFLQISGINVEYDFARKPGSRVTKVHVRCGDCLIPAYSALNYTAVYQILMPEFLSTGGDDFSVFVGLPATSLPYSYLAASIEYIKGHSPIYTAVEGRITINNYEKLRVNSASALNLSLFTGLFALVIIGNV